MWNCSKLKNPRDCRLRGSLEPSVRSLSVSTCADSIKCYTSKHILTQGAILLQFPGDTDNTHVLVDNTKIFFFIKAEQWIIVKIASIQIIYFTFKFKNITVPGLTTSGF